MKKSKYLIAIILIIIFTFSVVPKTFQNDTFYIIELGRGIMETGVDWKDHYSIHPSLEYRYPHWAFDVLNSWIYNIAGFDGIYVATQIFASIFMLLVFWNMLKKGIGFNLAFISTLVVSYMMKGSFYERGQIVSYSIFLVEYIVLERFSERPSLFKTLALIVLSCIMANVHSTAWIMMLVLILPFVGEQIVYAYSLKGVNERLLKKYKKKYKKAKNSNKSQEVLKILEEKIKQQEEFKIKNSQEQKENKIIITKKTNIKYMWVAVVALIIGSLMTPLKLTPILYVLKTAIGNSMGYINEHLPIIPANNLEFFAYSAIIIAMLGFTKSKLKLSDGFLILGLYLMTISGRRNVFLLIGLTSGIIVKMIDDFIKYNIKEENEKVEKVFYRLICVASIIVSVYMFVIKIGKPYVSKELYPVNATEYIKNNLDYKNARIYNGYDYGSYLLMEGVPVFLDSRCDLYTPEFNEGVKVFDDYMDVAYGEKTISSLMDKYDLKYAVVRTKSSEQTYMAEDDRYEELYKDKYFIVYKYE